MENTTAQQHLIKLENSSAFIRYYTVYQFINVRRGKAYTTAGAAFANTTDKIQNYF
jgi:hypothetical protein